ncbi:MAG: VacJ family lipoprotein [Gammaproteobacteria bacterium]|nr:VacJ family lipoprotein [Gammaproteobacteria bacterium]
MNKTWLLLAVFPLVACVNTGGSDYGVVDSHEAGNRSSYAITDWVDKKAIDPAARGYRAATPRWFRVGVGNFFSNLRGIDSAINGFLQGKAKSGATDIARLLMNSTIGLGGILDVAERIGLEHQEEDLGQTLATWGVTRTQYVYLPLLGPATLRDLPGKMIYVAVPRLVLGSGYGWLVGGLDLLNARADLLTATDARDASALDPYAFTREAYYQRRKFLIFDGDPPFDDFFDELEGDR